MSIFKDLTGLQVGDLTVLEFAYKKPRTDKNGGYTYYWWCLCKCGKLIAVRSTDLTRKDNRRRRSCNECKAKKTKEFHTKHGMYGTKIYHAWNGMIQRCENPNNKNFDQYGGRGIKVCQRWHVFENFYADVSILPHFGEEGIRLIELITTAIIALKIAAGLQKSNKLIIAAIMLKLFTTAKK